MAGKKNKASAAAEDDECVDVLFVLHDGFNLMDLAGPFEAFFRALNDVKDKGACVHHDVARL